MPVVTRRYVEQLCDLPLNGLIPPLAFNVLLLISCAAYAFKCRNFPENFNESKYIFASVSTTVFLWLAFVPTYFTAFYAEHKALLLALVLVLNSIVLTLSFYAPKVYALYYVDEDKLIINNMTSIGITKVSAMPVKVAPEK